MKKGIKNIISTIIHFICVPFIKILIYAISICSVMMWGMILYMLLSTRAIQNELLLFTSYSILLLVIIAHVLIYVVVDEGGDIAHDKIRCFLSSKNQTIWSYATFGLFTTFLLDMIYVVKANPGFELTYPGGINNNFTTVVSWIPLVNIFIYIKTIKSMQYKTNIMSTNKLALLYCKGKLAAYLINNR